jgi:hypothetical protein
MSSRVFEMLLPLGCATMKLKASAVMISVAALVLGWRFDAGAQQKQSKETAVIMEKKLKSSQRLL